VIGERGLIELNFHTSRHISSDLIEFGSDPNILPSMSPFCGEDIAHRSVQNNMSGHVVVHASDRWMLPKCRADLMEPVGVLGDISRLAPIDDEERGEGRLPVGIFSAPVVGGVSDRGEEQHSKEQ